uniref:Uncharacterized protein n=1 Tax=Molossus molossus TaxID=27622 RepID=A0A7J8F9L3_MOLMO|nr:hypothetical protein HJG59_008558 [Molossus molossus]
MRAFLLPLDGTSQRRYAGHKRKLGKSFFSGLCGSSERRTDRPKPGTRLCPLLVRWPQLQASTPWDRRPRVAGSKESASHLRQRWGCSGGQDNRNLRTQMLWPTPPRARSAQAKGCSNQVLVLVPNLAATVIPGLPRPQRTLECVIAGTALKAEVSPQPLGPRDYPPARPPRALSPSCASKTPLLGRDRGGPAGVGRAARGLCCGCLHTCN